MQAMKHYVWAQRQRQTFLRQRQDRALDYAQAGVPMRPAYALAAQQAAAELELDQAHLTNSLPGEEYMTQADPLRPSAAPGWGSVQVPWAFASSAEEGWSGQAEHLQGSLASARSPLSSSTGRLGTSIPLPKPTYGKVRGLRNALSFGSASSSLE